MDGAPPVQVITTLYESTLEVLLGFDIDSCCFAFELQRMRVVCTMRGQRALVHGINVADTGKAGPGYCKRLEKYTQRGFAIGLPGYLPDRVSKQFDKSDYVYLHKYGLLLQVGAKIPYNNDISVAQCDGLQARIEQVDVNVKAIQKGRSLWDMPRLLVLNSMKRGRADAIAKKATCVPVSAGKPGEYVLVWGAKLEVNAEDVEEDGFYTQTPLAHVNLLLDRHSNSETDSKSSQTETGLWTGGAMQRMYVTMADTCPGVTRFSMKHDKDSILFVYDFCSCATPYESLHFIQNANRTPLKKLNDDEFMKTYGLPAKLTFAKNVFRERATADWWEGVY